MIGTCINLEINTISDRLSQCNDLRSGADREKRGDRVITLAKINVHLLKFQDALESNIVIKGIAIVKSTANNVRVCGCVCECACVCVCLHKQWMRLW